MTSMIMPTLELILHYPEGNTEKQKVNDLFSAIFTFFKFMRIIFINNNLSYVHSNAETAVIERIIEDMLELLTVRSSDQVTWHSVQLYSASNMQCTDGDYDHLLQINAGWSKPSAKNHTLSLTLLSREAGRLTSLIQMLVSQNLLKEMVQANLSYRFALPLIINSEYTQQYYASYGLAKRYQAVAIDDPTALYLSLWRDHIKNIGWWNYYDKTVFNLLFEQSSAFDDLTITDCATGYILEVNSTPNPVDRNFNQTINTGLKEIYQLIKAYIPDHEYIYFPPWDNEETVCWLHRYR